MQAAFGTIRVEYIAWLHCMHEVDLYNDDHGIVFKAIMKKQAKKR